MQGWSCSAAMLSDTVSAPGSLAKTTSMSMRRSWLLSVRPTITSAFSWRTCRVPLASNPASVEAVCAPVAACARWARMASQRRCNAAVAVALPLGTAG